MVVAVVLIAALIISHRITRFEIIYFCVLIPSIILHEISHGVVALALGDDTAKRAGRLTLNPVKHVDPVGTLLVPAILSLSGIGAYGWAKPVPVSTNRLRSPRNHTVVVSLVGPITNFALAALLGVVLVVDHPLAHRAATGQLLLEQRRRGLMSRLPSSARSCSSPGSPTSCSASSTASRARPSTAPPSSNGSSRHGMLPQVLRPPALLDVPALHPHPALPEPVGPADQPRHQLRWSRASIVRPRAPSRSRPVRRGPYALAGALLLLDYAWLARGLAHTTDGRVYSTWSLDHQVYSDVIWLGLTHYGHGLHPVHPLPYVHDRIEYPVCCWASTLWLPGLLPGGPASWLAAAGVLTAATTFGSIALVRRPRPGCRPGGRRRPRRPYSTPASTGT